MANDPVLMAYASVKTRNGKNHWKRIGAAWPHEAGSGLTLQIDLIPNKWNGRLVLLEPDADDDARILKLAARYAIKPDSE